MKHSLDEFKKLLHKKEQQLKRQDRDFRHVMTKTIQLAAQVGNVYNLFLYKILNNLLKTKVLDTEIVMHLYTINKIYVKIIKN